MFFEEIDFKGRIWS